MTRNLNNIPSMGLKDWLYAESMLLLHRHTMAAPERGRRISI
jgi:hypothetical protein